jgi:low affinity Fe/Cu permease
MKEPANSSLTAGLSKKKSKRFFDAFSSAVTRGAGRPITTLMAFLLVLTWGLSGPAFGFSQTWQLIINTTTTIITFLMVFIIQQSQNRDSVAVQLKLNELIACHKKASNRLVDIEDLSAEELEMLRKFYVKLSRLAEDEAEIHSSHSIDEAQRIHEAKGSQAARKATRRTGTP